MNNQILKKLTLIIGILLIPTISFATNYCQDASIEGCWLMNDSSGGAVDSSSNGRHLSDNSADLTYSSAGQFGTSIYNTNTIGSALNFPVNAAFYSDPFSVVFWMKPDTHTANNVHFFGLWFTGSTKVWQINEFTDGRYYTKVNNTVPTEFSTYDAGIDTTCTAGNWCHVAITFDGTAGELKFYLNGTLMKTNSSFTGTLTGGGGVPAQIFDADQGAGNAWKGYIDEAAYFSRVLDLNEINEIKTNGLEGLTTSGIIYSGSLGASNLGTIQ